MNFSLSTPIERQATLAAITAYIEVLDGVRVQPQDNPATGAVEPPVVAAQVFGTVTMEPINPDAAAKAFGMVTVPPTPVPYPTNEQAATPLPEVPAAPVADPNLDVNGVAYNAEIHSTTRTKNKDGSWRLKRNTGGAEVPPAPPVVSAPPVVAAPPVVSAPPVVAAPPAPPAPAPVADAAPTTFKELMDRLAPLMQSGKVNFQAVSSACQLNGVAALPALNANVGAIPAVWATLQGMM